MYLYSLLALLLLACQSQSLDLIYSKTKLPSARYGHTIAFDGVDSVYLLGGIGDGYLDEIVKYSIDADTVQVVGEFEQVFGSAAWAGNNVIYQFGRGQAAEERMETWKIDAANPSNQSFIDFDSDWATLNSVALWDGHENVYLIEGRTSKGTYSDRIIKLSITTEIAKPISQTPSPRAWASAVWTGDLIYIFGGYNRTHKVHEILKVDPSTGQTEVVSVSLPNDVYRSTAVWNGREAYIIGGYSRTLPIPNLVRFNPTLNEIVEIEVKNFPKSLYWSTSVFVERKNRIYMFGGQIGVRKSDDIMYIDLPPPTTSLTETVRSD